MKKIERKVEWITKYKKIYYLLKNPFEKVLCHIACFTMRIFFYHLQWIKKPRNFMTEHEFRILNT